MNNTRGTLLALLTLAISGLGQSSSQSVAADSVLPDLPEFIKPFKGTLTSDFTRISEADTKYKVSLSLLQRAYKPFENDARKPSHTDLLMLARFGSDFARDSTEIQHATADFHDHLKVVLDKLEDYYNRYDQQNKGKPVPEDFKAQAKEFNAWLKDKQANLPKNEYEKDLKLALQIDNYLERHLTQPQK